MENEMPEAIGSALQPTGCCPPFDPRSWLEGERTWKDKLFVKDHVRSFLHVPLDMGRRMQKNQSLIRAAAAESNPTLVLSDESSLWGADIYIDVTKSVPGAQMTRLSGTFLTKVYEGPFKDAGKWAKDMGRYVEQQGRQVEKLYFAYTTCPACAKAYGKNYVVLFAQVASAKEGAAPCANN